MIGDYIGMEAAAEIAGRAPSSMRRAAMVGKLGAQKIGKTWVTTREDVSAYMAYVATKEWESVPQRQRGRRRGPRQSRAAP